VTTYVDSSALVPIYVPERFSASAREILQATPRVPFTALHELEVRNAFAMLLGRRLIDEEERDAIGAQLQEDVDARRLMPVDLDWPEVFASACELSASHSARLLTRSLDVMHVAAARATKCRVFVSADDRQLALAKAARFKIIDIKRARRGSRP